MLFNAVSDETLYLQMAQGCKAAHDTLMMRYDTIGRQMANSMIRIYNIRNRKAQDYYDAIYESIDKAFRYYSMDDSKFYPFCYEILRQNLYRTSQEFLLEDSTVSLDDNVNDSQNTYHDVVSIYDKEAELKKEEINLIIDKLVSSSNAEKRFVGKVFIMYKAGYTLLEIAAKTGRSYYIIRKIFDDAKLYFDRDYIL